MSKPIDQYTLELEALTEHDHSQHPVRAVATSTDDGSTVEAWLTKNQTRASLLLACSEITFVDYFMQQLEEHRSVDLISQYGSKRSDRLIFTPRELIDFGFDPDEFRPRRDELES